MSIARVAVVGAGLVGLTLAREISDRLPDAQVTVFDKEDLIAAHQSAHTSGIVDSGLEEAPGSLGATLCRRGVEKLVPYVSERGIPYRECGQLYVAQNTDDADRLEELLARAEANGIPGVRLLDRRQMREVEPHARGVLALYSPHTAVIDYPALAEALASDVRAAGGTIRLGAEVTSIDVMANEVRVRVRTSGTPGEESDGRHEVRPEPGDARAGAGSGAGTGDDGDLDEQVQEVPRTYHGRDADPVIGLGDELRSRFGDKDWFRQVEETLEKWGEKISGAEAGRESKHDPATGRAPGAGRGSEADREPANVRPASPTGQPHAGSPRGDHPYAGRAHADQPPADQSRSRRSRIPDEDAGSFDLVLVSAGLHADRLAAAAGLDPEPRIVPFTSDWFVVAEPDAEVVHGIISSVPDPKAPLTRTTLARSVHGSLLLGPNTYPSLGREAYERRDFDVGDLGTTLGFKGFWKFASQNAKTAVRGAKAVVSTSAFVEGVQKYVPEIKEHSVRPGPRGVHAQTIDSAGELRDELLVTTRGRLTEVRNVPRSGATSALAMAEHIVDQALRAYSR